MVMAMMIVMVMMMAAMVVTPPIHCLDAGLGARALGLQRFGHCR
jgi:hypothetical protein